LIKNARVLEIISDWRKVRAPNILASIDTFEAGQYAPSFRRYFWV